MKYRNIIVLITAVVLLFLLVFPSVYIQSECSDYLKNIETIKTAIINRDAGLAAGLIEEKLVKWDENNILILSFTPHAETEFIKDSIIKLDHSVQLKEFDLALERADILYSQIDHLIQSSRFSWENLF